MRVELILKTWGRRGTGTFQESDNKDKVGKMKRVCPEIFGSSGKWCEFMICWRSEGGWVRVGAMV